MVTQKTLKQLRDNLKLRFNTFSNDGLVRSYVEKEMKKYFAPGLYSDEKCSEVFKSAIKHLEETVNTEYSKAAQIINEYIDDLRAEFKYDDSYGRSNVDTFEHVAVGAGAGLGAALLLGGPLGFLTLIGAAISGLVGSDKKKKELVSKIRKAADELNGEAIEKLSDILDIYIIEDELLENPKNQINATQDIVEDETNLSKEQLEIKHFLEKRGIKYLIHFTDAKNVESIKKYGICSPKEGKKLGIKIDVNNVDLSAHKADRYMSSTPDDYISLTITRMNEKVLARFKHDKKIKDVRRFVIDASILWKEIDKDRIYCNMNAHARYLSCGKRIDDFERMFVPTIEQVNYENEYSLHTREGFPDNVCTHEQAEILFCSRVDPKYFINEQEAAPSNNYKSYDDDDDIGFVF